MQLEVRTTAQASHEHQLSKISLVDPTAYLFSMQNSSILTHISNSKQFFILQGQNMPPSTRRKGARLYFYTTSDSKAIRSIITLWNCLEKNHLLMLFVIKVFSHHYITYNYYNPPSSQYQCMAGSITGPLHFDLMPLAIYSHWLG